MGNYLTATDYVVRFGEDEAARLTGVYGDPRVNEGVIDEAILDAEAIVDGYLRVRYTPPLAPAPREIVAWTADLARERLHTDVTPDAVRQAADRAIRGLREVADGVRVLAADATPAPAASGEVVIDGPDWQFSSDALSRF